MPEFGTELHRKIIWDWKAYYLNYDRLKAWIRELESNESAKAYSCFYEELETCLKRVDHFYLAQELELRHEVQRLEDATPEPTSAKNLNLSTRLRDDIERLILFAEQNREGFRKATKKFDKRVPHKADGRKASVENSLQARMLEVVKIYPFVHARVRLEKLLDAVTDWEEGNVALFRTLSEVTHGSSARHSIRSALLGPPSPPLSPWQRWVDWLPKGRASFRRLFREQLSFIAVTLFVSLLAWRDVSSKLTPSSYLVMLVTFFALVFLIRQHAPDKVMMSATLFLTISTVLSPQDAWRAFSNDVVLSVAGLGVVAHVVQETGVIDMVFSVFLGKPKSLQLALLRLFLPAIVLNVGVSNTCVMSCLLPVVNKWSAEIEFHKGFFLLPLSYILLISGTFTMFSTSTNLIAQGLLSMHHVPKFSMFALAFPSLVATIISIVYLTVVSPIVLNRFKKSDRVAPLKSSRNRRINQYDVRVQVVGKSLDEESICDSDVVGALSGGGLDVLAVERYGKLISFGDLLRLQLDDVIWIRTSIEGVSHLFLMPGLRFLALDLSEEWASLGDRARDLLEAVLDRESPLVGCRMGNARKVHPNHQCTIIGYRAYSEVQGLDAPEESLTSSVELGATPETVLRHGDHILLDAAPTFYKAHKDDSEFVVLTRICRGDPTGEEAHSKRKAITSGLLLLCMILLVGSGTMHLLEAVLLTLAACVGTNITTMDAVVKAVKLRTVLTIVGAFGLGVAIGQEHVADVLAQLLIAALSPFGHRGLTCAIFACTVALGVVFHGTAVVVLMYPICAEVSSSAHMPMHQLMAVLCIAVSCQMLTPISYQTNLMAYSTGAYRFEDFTKVGAGLVLLIAIATIPICEQCFPV